MGDEKLRDAARAECGPLCERSVKHGARVVHAPQTHPYGERQATLEDFAGHTWTLTQTVEDVDPAAWGGEAAQL